MNKKIGRFEVRSELGRGAQSVVYLGFDPQLQREVAIKTVRFSQPDTARNKVLLDEARTVSKLRHANIVPILMLVKKLAGSIWFLNMCRAKIWRSFWSVVVPCHRSRLSPYYVRFLTPSLMRMPRASSTVI